MTSISQTTRLRARAVERKIPPGPYTVRIYTGHDHREYDPKGPYGDNIYAGPGAPCDIVAGDGRRVYAGPFSFWSLRTLPIAFLFAESRAMYEILNHLHGYLDPDTYKDEIEDIGKIMDRLDVAWGRRDP